MVLGPDVQNPIPKIILLQLFHYVQSNMVECFTILALGHEPKYICIDFQQPTTWGDPLLRKQIEIIVYTSILILNTLILDYLNSLALQFLQQSLFPIKLKIFPTQIKRKNMYLTLHACAFDSDFFIYTFQLDILVDYCLP